MRRRVRALPVMLIGVFAVVAASIGVASAPAFAATGAGTVAPARTPKASGATVASTRPAKPAKSPAQGPASLLQLSPVGGPRIDVALDPGATTQRSFEVTNRSTTLRLTVALNAVDATAQPNGDLRYASTASNDGPASWVTLSDLVATLEPGASTRVQVTVAPSADALPGSVVAGVVASVDQAARADNGTAVSAHASAALPIAIKVNGAPTALVSISSVGAVKDHGDEFLAITFQNSGATREHDDRPGAGTRAGWAHIRDPCGGRPTEAHDTSAPVHDAARHEDRLGVGHNRRRRGRPGELERPGRVRAPARGIGSGRVGHAERERADLVDAGLSHAAALPRPVLILVGVAVLLAAIWFVAELRRNRSRRRSVAIVPAMAGAFATYALGTSDPLGAVVSQLGALVEAIDRLVSGLGTGPAAAEVAPPASVAATVVPPPASAPEPTAVSPVAASGCRRVFDQFGTGCATGCDAACARGRSAVHSGGRAARTGSGSGAGCHTTRSAPAPTPTATPVAQTPAAELAELARLLSLPAAPSVPELDESDPYDWPTQQQLDQFADRRRETQGNPE